VVTIFALSSSLLAQNTINAVTSASGKLRLISGQAFSTYAKIVWNDEYDNGTIHQVRWGTLSGTYPTNINLKPFSANTNTTDSIPNLTPATLYYAQFYRTYDGRTYTTNFSFTTTAAQTGVLSHTNYSKPVTLLKNSTVTLFGANGRIIKQFVLESNLTSVAGLTAKLSRSVAHGVYQVTVIPQIGHSASFSSKIVL
jgi:hypothetical protein